MVERYGERYGVRPHGHSRRAVATDEADGNPRLICKNQNRRAEVLHERKKIILRETGSHCPVGRTVGETRIVARYVSRAPSCRQVHLDRGIRTTFGCGVYQVGWAAPQGELGGRGREGVFCR